MKYAVHWRYRSSVEGSSFSLLKRSLKYLSLKEVLLVPSIAEGSSIPKNVQGLRARHRLARGSPTPKANAQNSAPIHWEHSHLTGTKMEGPRVMKEPLHPASHQRMAHIHVWDAEKRAEAQLRQKLAVLLASITQELAEVRPPSSTGALDTRILRGIREKSVSTKRSWKAQSKRDMQKHIDTSQRRTKDDGWLMRFVIRGVSTTRVVTW
jgi:hypothetical protein